MEGPVGVLHGTGYDVCVHTHNMQLRPACDDVMALLVWKVPQVVCMLHWENFLRKYHSRGGHSLRSRIEAPLISPEVLPETYFLLVVMAVDAQAGPFFTLSSIMLM